MRLVIWASRACAEFGALAVGVGADLGQFPVGLLAGPGGVGAGLVRAGLGRGGALGRGAGGGLVPGGLVAGGVPVGVGGADLLGGLGAGLVDHLAGAGFGLLDAGLSVGLDPGQLGGVLLDRGGQPLSGFLAAGLLDGQVPAGFLGCLVGQGAELAFGGSALLGLGPAGFGDRGAFLGGGPGRFHLCLGRGGVADRVG